MQPPLGPTPPQEPQERLPLPPGRQMQPPASPRGGGVSPRGEGHVSCPTPNLPSNGSPRTDPVQWSTDLCACSSDMRTCCLTFSFPCVTFGEIAEIVDKGSSSCVMNGVVYGLILLFGCACIYSCVYRKRMRKQFNITGSTCRDCCTHYWCECCALCQEHRELKARGFNLSQGWQAHMQQQNNEVMTVPPTKPGMRR